MPTRGRTDRDHIVKPKDTRKSACKRGYDRQWRKRRLLFLNEHPCCIHCQKKGFYEPATEVDHIKPLHAGGSNEDNNLQPLCHSCHSSKTARENASGGVL